VKPSTASPDGQVLPRELSEFLVEFLGAHQRFAMYPAGHPLLDPSVDSLLRRLNQVFLERPTLTIAVTPSQLIVSGVPTDPEHSLLRDLAARLHRRNIGGIRFLRGVGRAELGSLVGVVALEGDGQIVSPHDEPGVQWPHIRLLGPEYDRLQFVDEEDDERSLFDPLGGTWAGRLWLGLARAALGEQLSDQAAALAEPEEIARAISTMSGDARRDEHVVTALADLADACRGRGRVETLALQRQLSRLIGGIAPAALERLMHMGGSLERRRRWLLQAADIMAADVIVALVDAAARASNRTLSPAILQLLSKLSVHAGDGAPRTRLRAEQALRERIRTLIERWEAAPAGGTPEYERVLEALPGAERDAEAVLVYGPEPQRIILTSLELGLVQAGTRRAVDRMIERGETGLLLDLLERLPATDPGATEIRGWVHAPGTVRRLLAFEPPELETLARVLPATGLDALGPLLDALGAAKERKVRARLMDLVAHLGPGAGEEIAARITGAPWYVQRNLLRLLAALPALPEGFSIAAHVRHPDPRVRHEALRIMLRDRARRSDGVRLALQSSDPPTLRLGIVAAAESCPPNVTPLLLERIRSTMLDPQLRALAIRAVASVDHPSVVAMLLSFAEATGRLPFLRKLAPRSPEMLAALAGLAAHWPYHLEAGRVLALAARSRDPEVRKAGAMPAREPGADAVPSPRVIM
jgi:hypothetical protein